ncbi:lipoprotein [Streptomyces thioluteus]|uniref:Lipoprotein n=1 Tax=Streptomyces thioluteus TaxID=66431 RepID=A0ABN3WVC6_STRTU
MRRALVAALLLGALAPLAGCGIERTEVIEFGQPATGVKRPGEPGWQARLYFAIANGVVVGVTRPADGPVSAESAVELMLAGPNDAERARSYFSEVVMKSGPGTGVSVAAERGRVTIQLPLDVSKLTRPARTQLVCTAAHNEVPGGLRWTDVKVTLAGGGKKLPDLVCDRG